MFSILLQEERPGPLRRLFGGPRVELRTFKKLRFAVVSLPSVRRADFHKLRKILGRTGGNLVVQRGIQLPHGCGLALLDTGPYARSVLRTTLDSMLRRAKIPLRELNTLLFDPSGRELECAKVLVKYSGRLKIVTGAQALYEDFSHRMLEEYGAVVSVEDTLENPSHCRLVVAPGGLGEQAPLAGDTPVLSVEDCGAQRGYFGFRVPLPGAYRELIPAGVDEFDFQAALYSLCHVLALGKIPAAACLRCGQEIPVERMAADILEKTADFNL